MPWRPLPLSYAVAIYSFQPGSSQAELPLQIGDQLYVIEEGGRDWSWCRGYLLAPPSLLSALSNDGHGASDARVFSGIFPKCCIEIKERLGSEVPNRGGNGGKPPAPVPMLKVGDDSTPSHEPLVDEISSCLREWYVSHLPDLVLDRVYEKLERMSTITTRLDYARRQLLNDVLTLQEREGVREQAVWDLVEGNKMLGGEVIVRDPSQLGKLCTADDSAIQMAKLQSTMSVLNSAPKGKKETLNLHHCLVEVKSVMGTHMDSMILSLGLYLKTADTGFLPYSETYTAPASQKIRALISDMSALDVASESKLYLVVKVIDHQPPKSAPARPTMDRPPSRSGTTKLNRDTLLSRRRSGLMFGSIRKSEKPQLAVNGRTTPALVDRTSLAPSKSSSDESGGSKDLGPPIPRTLGVGLLDIARIMKTPKPQTATIAMWTAATRDEEKMNYEPNIGSFLPSPLGGYTICNKVSQIHLSLEPYASPESALLIRMNPTSMHELTRMQKIGFSKAPTKPRSDIYLTLVGPTILPGAQLAHPEAGLVPLKSSPLLNLQLTMEVRDGAGQRIEHCIYGAANAAGVTAFRTYATELNSSWAQTICIRVPRDKVKDSHVILSVADAPDFPFALAWFPLFEKGAFIQDGMHSLILDAYDKSTSSVVHGRGRYLSLPWNSENYLSGHDGVIAPVASLQVETQLCSTEFSQDRILAALINWKRLQSPHLMDMLQKLVFVPELEIVKQLNSSLDALLAILVHKAGEGKFEDLIFNDIVFVFGIANDKRYNVKGMIDDYIENHLNAPLAASRLVRSLTRMLQSVSDPQSSRDMRALFKVGDKVVKLIMSSYQQRKMSMQNGDHDKKHASFTEDMQAVLFGLQMMMKSETPALIGSKTLLVQNLHTWFPELLAAYSEDEVVRIAIDFVEACEDAEGKLLLHRLIFILHLTKVEQLWVDSKDRQAWMEHCVRWLGPSWEYNDLSDDWKEQVRLSCSIVAEFTKQPTVVLYDFMPKLLSTYCIIASDPPTTHYTLSLLFSQSYPFTTKPTSTNDRFDETLLELSSLISAICKTKLTTTFKLPPSITMESYITSILTFLTSLLIHNTAYPPTWLSLHIYQHSTALTLLSHVFHLLTIHFLPDPEAAESFLMPLWKDYLLTLLSLLSSSALTLETFPEQKRRAVWKIGGDIRQSGAELLRRSWLSLGWDTTEDDLRRYHLKRLGGYQVQYVPSLVQPVVEMCLSMHEGLRRAGVEILQSMIVSEWGLSEDLEIIETEVIEALNNSLRDNRGQMHVEVVSRKLWVEELNSLFATIANQPEDALWESLEELLMTVEELIDLMASGDGNDGERSTIRSSTRKEIEADRRKRSVTTEGTDDDRVVEERTTSRAQGGRENGSRVYGEHALECYKQLAEEYERNGDYKRLAKTHRAMARIHENRAASRLGAVGEGDGSNGHEYGYEED